MQELSKFFLLGFSIYICMMASKTLFFIRQEMLYLSLDAIIALKNLIISMLTNLDLNFLRFATLLKTWFLTKKTRTIIGIVESWINFVKNYKIKHLLYSSIFSNSKSALLLNFCSSWTEGGALLSFFICFTIPATFYPVKSTGSASVKNKIILDETSSKMALLNICFSSWVSCEISSLKNSHMLTFMPD